MGCWGPRVRQKCLKLRYMEPNVHHDFLISTVVKISGGVMAIGGFETGGLGIESGVPFP